MSAGKGELFDEVHGDGVLGMVRNWELLEGAVWEMLGSLVPLADHAGADIVADKESEAGPVELAEHEGCRAILALVSGEDMVVLEAKDAKAEVLCCGNVDSVVEPEESGFIEFPA